MNPDYFLLHKRLEELYLRYNKREYVHPDPLEFLYNYKATCDREIVGLIASSLAYGRVKQILKSVSCVLGKMGHSPHDYLKNTPEKLIKHGFKCFKHRFAAGHDISGLLIGIKNVIRRYGSLKKCFMAGINKKENNITHALEFFVREITALSHTNVLSSPEKGSACKRLNLFLRWMIRHDDVDPGGWDDIPPAKLIIPLDTHMYKISKALGFTKRKQANLKTALEITEAFLKIVPEDPTKYDFALTRLGIRDDADMGAFIRSCSNRRA